MIPALITVPILFWIIWLMARPLKGGDYARLGAALVSCIYALLGVLAIMAAWLIWALFT